MTTAKSQPLSLTPITGLRLLIVDDEPMLRSVILEFLKLLGFTCHHAASDGRQALDLLARQPIDCILSDIRMPEMELEEMLPIVRSRWPDSAVIATSGYSDLEYAHHILILGADDFLGKPLHLDSLETALAWIAWRRDLLKWIAGFENEGQPGREEFEAAIRSAPVFADRMAHSIRVARLLDRLQTGLGDEKHRELRTAALLHEIGLGELRHNMLSQPRRLQPHEQTLVRGSAITGGRQVAQALGRPSLGGIIQEHLQWREMTNRTIRQNPLLESPAWLGLANLIDGCVNARADRPPITPPRLRETLDRRRRNYPLDQIDQLLDQWPAILEQVAAGDAPT